MAMARGLLSVLLLGLALSPAEACAEFRGKVQVLVNPEAARAEWRRAPLRDAYVIVAWTVTVPAPAQAVTTCRYSELARSDEKGNFVMQGPDAITASLGRASFLAYAGGMEAIDFPYEGSRQSPTDITMARTRLDANRRLSRLVAYTDPFCHGVKVSDPHGLVNAFHQALLQEARSLDVAPADAIGKLRSLETAARRTSGGERPEPMRAIARPSPGAIQPGPPVPPK